MIVNILSINQIRPYEQVNPALVKVLYHKIKNDGIFTEPVLIDKDTNIIINGHHRLQVCKRLGLSKIPCIVVDYKGVITVTTSKGNKVITKDFILQMVNNGLFFPFKVVNYPELRYTTQYTKILLTSLK